MRICALLLAAGSVCFAADAPKTFTGVVQDDMCGADHKKMGGTDPVKCAQECVNSMGAKYALVSGNDVYVLSDQAAAAKFIAKKVTVTGALGPKPTKKYESQVLKIQSIAAAK